MKANTVSRSAQRAAQKEFNKLAHECAARSTQASLAVVMWLMATVWGCKPATCRKRFGDIKAIYDIGEVMGKPLTDTDCINWCREHLGVDVQELKVKVKVDYV